MTKIRLHIGDTWEQMIVQVDEIVRRYEAGELTEDCDADFCFQSWDHFASALRAEAPALADELLTMREVDRFAIFDTPAGQQVLARLWDQMSVDTSCPG